MNMLIMRSVKIYYGCAEKKSNFLSVKEVKGILGKTFGVIVVAMMVI